MFPVLKSYISFHPSEIYFETLKIIFKYQGSPIRNNSKDSFQKYQSGQQRTTDFISIILGFDSALWQTIFSRKDQNFTKLSAESDYNVKYIFYWRLWDCNNVQ